MAAAYTRYEQRSHYTAALLRKRRETDGCKKRLDCPMDTFLNFIDGRFQPPENDRWLSVHEPATGLRYARVAASGPDDVEHAVAAAQAALPDWATMPADARSRLLNRIAQGIETHKEALVALESLDTGKPESLARRVDIARAALNFRFYAAATTQFFSESHNSTGALNVTLRNPIGTAGCISPWNLPLYLLSWKVAPALAAGCTVVAKPSEWTPATAARLAAIATEAGLPNGVLNIIHGTGLSAGQALVEHPNVAALSFTGGTQTGAEIARRAAPQFKKLSLELGGKNPTIIFADCDFDAAVSGAIRAAFSNQGEICLCGSRILVEYPLYAQFREAFTQAAKHLRIGDPKDPKTDIGAIISQSHYEKILSFLAQAEKDGGRILLGGKAVTLEGRLKQGWYVSPTVIENLDNQSTLNQEEIFGPVVTLIPFKDETEALKLSNEIRYGLAASLWTENLGKALRVAEQLQAGLIWVNCWMLRDLRTPMGGLKCSGISHEGGLESLRFFTTSRNVCIRYGKSG